MSMGKSIFVEDRLPLGDHALLFVIEYDDLDADLELYDFESVLLFEEKKVSSKACLRSKGYQKSVVTPSKVNLREIINRNHDVLERPC